MYFIVTGTKTVVGDEDREGIVLVERGPDRERGGASFQTGGGEGEKVGQWRIPTGERLKQSHFMA